MSHSFYKIWIHAIWSTKYRAPLIQTSVEHKVYKYLTEQLQEQGCPVRIVNGMPDHVHCLFLLNPKKNVIDIMKQVKGSSSHFISENNLIPDFSWQTGYAAFSVSESGVDNVYRYIKNQKIHHRKKSSQQELDEFLRLYGLNNEDE